MSDAKDRIGVNDDTSFGQVLDGLDEAAAQRPAVLEVLRRLTTRTPTALCIVSTRPAGVDDSWFALHARD